MANNRIELGDGTILMDLTEDTVTRETLVKGSVAHDSAGNKIEGSFDPDSKYLPLTGGKLTGNLEGKYITGTWLQTTEATDLGRAPGKIAVLDDSGWVYYRTPVELLADIGAATVRAMLDKVYPVGAIYMSVNSTNPKTLFGGTWVQIKDRFLLAAGTTYKAGATGGEATHTLIVDEIPNHQHVLWYPNEGGEQSAAIGYPEAGSKNTWYAEASKTGGTGGGGAHNNMPPYLAVYMWKRTA